MSLVASLETGALLFKLGAHLRVFKQPRFKVFKAGHIPLHGWASYLQRSSAKSISRFGVF